MLNKGAVINGQKYYDRGDYDEALKQLRIADTSNIEAQLLIARSYEAKGERGLAKAHYRTLADNHPETAEGVYSKNKLNNF
jgi:Tfp pilus assembly protein PilF